MTYPPQPGQPYDPAQQPAQPDPYAQGQPAPNPYGQPAPDPYAQPAQDPYAQQAQYPPQQPDAYGHTSGAPYGPPAGDPYAQPPTQGFQPQGQPMYGAPPAQKSKVGLFAAIGGGAALVVILLVVLLIALSGGGPGGAVEDYLAAAKEADFEEANSYVCSIESSTYMNPGDFTDPADLAEWKAEVADLEWEILTESEVGDTATVTVKITSSSELLAGTHDFTLKKIDGDWKVCSTG